MIPIHSESQKQEILAVADLIKSEVNVKEVEVLEDASDILVKQIKPNFKEKPIAKLYIHTSKLAFVIIRWNSLNQHPVCLSFLQR